MTLRVEHVHAILWPEVKYLTFCCRWLQLCALPDPTEIGKCCLQCSLADLRLLQLKATAILRDCCSIQSDSCELVKGILHMTMMARLQACMSLVTSSKSRTNTWPDARSHNGTELQDEHCGLYLDIFGA